MALFTRNAIKIKLNFRPYKKKFKTNLIQAVKNTLGLKSLEWFKMDLGTKHMCIYCHAKIFKWSVIFNQFYGIWYISGFLIILSLWPHLDLHPADNISHVRRVVMWCSPWYCIYAPSREERPVLTSNYRLSVIHPRINCYAWILKTQILWVLKLYSY
jgi:hypothetical protein